MARQSAARNPRQSQGGASSFKWLLIIVAILVGIVWLATRSPKPAGVEAPAGVAVAPEVFDGVNPEGAGGDPMLNREKNRNTRPEQTTEMSVGQIIAIPSGVLDEEGRRQRRSWNADAQHYLAQKEGTGVRVMGYLIRVKESGSESCNGNSASDHDFHIWISTTPTGEKSESIIVEMTPKWKHIHPEWSLHAMQQLADQHAKVRVSGWLMWDEEHANEVEKSRGTQWEVHPVTDLEVADGAGWRRL